MMDIKIKPNKFNEQLKQAEVYIKQKEIEKATKSYIGLKVEYEEFSGSLSKEEAQAFHKKISDIHSKLINLKTRPKEKKISWLFKKKQEIIEAREPVKKGRLNFGWFKEKFKRNQERKSYKEEVIRKRKHKLKFYLAKAGITIDPSIVSKRLFNLCIILNLIISSFLMYHFSINLKYTLLYLILVMVLLWLFVFPLLLAVAWVFFYIFVDLKMFNRKNDLEDVLPDFLQLTSANIRAGMTIEKALWYAVRPRFGVLAKEIETVAKDTIGGKDLKDALKTFSEKYDSDTLKKSVALLTEGIEAGGEIGSLLNKIALNIQESKVMRKEMAANVTTYVIFISFATIAAAPFLFALSAQLIGIIKGLTSTMGPTASYGFAISFTGGGITPTDFKIFAVISLLITSFFSSVIIATIKKGDVKSGIKYIPIFMASTLILFFLANWVLSKLLEQFF